MTFKKRPRTGRRENGRACGAGGSAGRGLARFTKGKNAADTEGYTSGNYSLRGTTRTPDKRSPEVREIQKSQGIEGLQGIKDARKKIFTEKAQRDINEFLRIYKKPAPEIDYTDPKIREIVEKISKDPVRYAKMYLRDFEHRLTPEKVEAIFNIGLKFLEQGNAHAAYFLFDEMVSVYLDNREKGKIPHKYGQKAIEYARILLNITLISWYSKDVETDLSAIATKQGLCLIRPGFMSPVIELLKKVGTSDELLVVGHTTSTTFDSSAEVMGSKASKRIILNEFLRAVLDQTTIQEFELDENLSKEQIVHRLGILFDQLGLSAVLGQLEIIRKMNSDTMDLSLGMGASAHMMDAAEIKDLLEKGLDQEISITTTRMHTIVPSGIFAEEFSLENGLVQKIGRNCKLTEKGKQLVRNLFGKLVINKPEQIDSKKKLTAGPKGFVQPKSE